MLLSDYAWGRARLIGYTEDGSHWYQKSDGTVCLISKEIMKSDEDAHLRPNPPGYDPIWSYNWYLLGEEIDKRYQMEKFLNALTPEQLNQLKEDLK
jgi:hypothetical protein